MFCSLCYVLISPNMKDIVRHVYMVRIKYHFLTCSFVSIPQFSKFTFNISNNTVSKVQIITTKLSIPIIPNKPPKTAHVSITKLISCQGDIVVLKGYFALINKPSSIGEKNNKAVPNIDPNAVNP